MNKEERLAKMKEILLNTNEAVSGTKLALALGVSRQVIVQYVGILKAEGLKVLATSQGYLLEKSPYLEKIVQVKHTDEEIREELYLFVDAGALVKDVYVMHPIYGKVLASLNVSSRNDVDIFMNKLQNEEASPLKNITDNIHFHTILVRDETIYSLVLNRLKDKNFLVN